MREYYYIALTGRDLTGTEIAPSKEDRDAYFARTFRGLGHQMHLIEDIAQPDHVRNDSHIVDSLFENNLYGSYYLEAWAAKKFPKIEDLKDFAPNPILPSLSFDTSNDALVPITQLIDTDQYNGASPSTSLSQGLAEYTNANFFSDDTIFAAERYSAGDEHYFPYPKRSSTDLDDYISGTKLSETIIDEDGNEYTNTWISKVSDGEIIDHFITPSYLTDLTYFIFGEGSLYYSTFYRDEKCHEDYATQLIPKAVGYSAELLNYFFRGEIGIVHMSHNKSITITNLSSEKMVGTFRLYYDAADGTRKSIRDDSWSMPLEAGKTTIEYTYTEPNDLGEERRYIMVFKGQLGNESEAVVGKVWHDNNELLVYVKSIEVSDPIFLINFYYGFCHGGTFNYLSLSPEQVKERFMYNGGGSISSYFTKVTYELGILGKDVSEITSVNLSGVAGMFRTGNSTYCQDLREEIYQTITVKIGQNIWSTTSSKADYPREIYGRTQAHVTVSMSLSNGEQIDFVLTDDHAPTYKKLCDLPMAECANRDHIAVLETHFSFPSSPVVLHNNGFDLEPDFTFEIGGYSETTRQDFDTEFYPCEDIDGNIAGYLDVPSGEELIVDGPSLTKGITETYRWYRDEYLPDTLTNAPSISTTGYVEKMTTNGDAIKTFYIVNTPY